MFPVHLVLKVTPFPRFLRSEVACKAKVTARGESGIRGDGYTGLVIADASVSFIKGGTGGKSSSSKGALVGGHLHLD